MKFLLSLVAILVPGVPVFSQSCNCPENLNRLSILLQENYAGYRDKVTSKTEASYLKHLARLKQKAPTKTNAAGCQEVLREYLQYFRDQHLQFSFKPSQTDISSSKPETYPVDLKELKTRLKQQRESLHPIEGIWKNENYTLAVIRDSHAQKQSFVGVVLESANGDWKPGYVKMSLQVTSSGGFSVDYRMADFSHEKTEAILNQNVLDLRWIGPFWRQSPSVSKPLAPSNYLSPFPQAPIEIRWLDEQTVVIKFQSFDPSYKPLIDSTLTAHETRLKQTPNWIVDVRFNGGGGTGTYQSLLPYLYTHPIVRTGSRYWTSPANIAEYRKLNLRVLDEVVTFGEKNPNAWFESKGDTLRFAEIRPNPRRVAILAGRHTGSAAEILLLHARQSQKVTIFGENTGGVLDYGDGVTHSLPYVAFNVTIPVRRSNYLDYVRYDNIGIPPDVRIPIGTVDWYAFVRNHWKQGRKTPLTKAGLAER